MDIFIAQVTPRSPSDGRTFRHQADLEILSDAEIPIPTAATGLDEWIIHDLVPILDSNQLGALTAACVARRLTTVT